MGLPHGGIERLCHIARAASARYLREYQEGGAGRLRELRESARMEYRDAWKAASRKTRQPASTMRDSRG